MTTHKQGPNPGLARLAHQHLSRTHRIIGGRHTHNRGRFVSSARIIGGAINAYSGAFLRIIGGLYIEQNNPLTTEHFLQNILLNLQNTVFMTKLEFKKLSGKWRTRFSQPPPKLFRNRL